MPATHNYGTSNLHPLCRTHHRLKTHHGWTVTRTRAPNRADDPAEDDPAGGDPTNADSAGIITTDHWTSPLGLHHTSHPYTPWQPDPPTGVPTEPTRPEREEPG